MNNVASKLLGLAKLEGRPRRDATRQEGDETATVIAFSRSLSKKIARVRDGDGDDPKPVSSLRPPASACAQPHARPVVLTAIMIADGSDGESGKGKACAGGAQERARRGESTRKARESTENHGEHGKEHKNPYKRFCFVCRDTARASFNTRQPVACSVRHELMPRSMRVCLYGTLCAHTFLNIF